MKASLPNGWKGDLHGGPLGIGALDLGPSGLALEYFQSALHYGAHWIGPFLIAAMFWRQNWLRAGLVIAAANLIDFDHVLADPIFDPNRCSVGFHLLHGWEAALVFAALLLVPRWWAKAFGTGALWHLCVDAGDCLAMTAIQP